MATFGFPVGVGTTIETGEVADDAITLAKMAPGTDGNLITYDANGDPAYVATGNATQVLTSNGAGAAPTFSAPPGSAINTYTSSDTWNKPATGNVAFIQCWGGGGAGGTGADAAGNYGAGGGGGGAYNEKWVPLASLGSTETVTVWAAGAAGGVGANGGNGGLSSFGTWLLAGGGGGGQTGAVAALGGGGGSPQA